MIIIICYYFRIKYNFKIKNINLETKINLHRKLEIYNNSVIEIVLDYNVFDFTLISEYNEDFYKNDTLIDCFNDDLEYFGKTIINKKF